MLWQSLWFCVGKSLVVLRGLGWRRGGWRGWNGGLKIVVRE